HPRSPSPRGATSCGCASMPGRWRPVADGRRPTVAVVFARGGSKGVPGKNLRLVGGVPLVGRAVRAARACPGIDRVVVSTDDEEIAAAARAHGAEVPWMRPAE